MRMHKLKIHKHKMIEVSSAAPLDDTLSDVNGEEEIILEGDDVSKEVRRSSNAENEIILDSLIIFTVKSEQF